jgi:hypothetical protein
MPKHRSPLGVFDVKERFDQPAEASILSVTPVSRSAYPAPDSMEPMQASTHRTSASVRW